MRVLVVTNMYPTAAQPWFGCFVKEQVEDLRELGVDIDVVDFDGRSEKAAYLDAAREVRLRDRRRSHDLIHAHYGLTGAVVALARPRVPLLTTFHGSDFAGPMWQRMVSIAVARRSTPIVVGAAGRTRLFVEKAEVIPMGVDTTLFAPGERRIARRALGWPQEGHYALLAGSRANPVKGGDLFDSAVREASLRLPGLTGMALEGYDRDGVALALNAADVTVLTSHREGSPVTVRESLACETPVVSVAVGDVPAVISGLPGCAVVVRDPGALASGIEEAVRAPRDPRLRARAEESSRGAVANQVRSLYGRVLDRTSTSRHEP
jgi:teichuronic acid biosynthesis glycosyltransferase TuaC